MRKIYILLGIVVFFAISVFKLHAQPSQGGTPPSIEFGIKTDLVVKEFVPAQSLKTLQAQDLQDAKQGLPMRAGVSVPVANLGLDKGGTWTRLPDGRMMWQSRLKSSGASSLGVVFEDFYIPEQAELYLYDVNKRMIIGAFTSENNHPSLQFSTHVLPGDEIIIEYVEPFNISVQQVKPQNPDGKVNVYTINSEPDNYRSKGSFRISELMYIYNDKIYSQAKDLGDSGTCEVNINCSPEGDGYQVQKRGIARILFREGANWYYCSGTLINNTANNGQPYFLTAYHCGASASAADKNVWQFYFNYERPGCANTGTPPNNMITGCTMKASGDISGGSDLQLVMLNTTPSLSWNPYYNGWDRNATGSAGGVGIHHPSGDAKKISTYTGTPGTGTWSGGATNAHWTLSWATTTNGSGVTEGGSSGSPLFRGSNKYVIGTLTGGSSQCGGPMGTDYYGKMSYHWESNGTTDD